MRTIVCLLFFLLLTLSYVGSGSTNVVFRLSISLLGLKFSLYLVRILYFVVICIIIRLHQSKKAHSTTCQVLLICKYEILSIFPCCNFQNMNMFSQWYFLFSTILCEMWLWNEGLSHEGQQFHQYQQNKQSPLTSTSLTIIKTRTCNVGNSGTGLGQPQTPLGWYLWHCWPSLFTQSIRMPTQSWRTF
jgi:hypothetical protein